MRGFPLSVWSVSLTGFADWLLGGVAIVFRAATVKGRAPAISAWVFDTTSRGSGLVSRVFAPVSGLAWSCSRAGVAGRSRLVNLVALAEFVMAGTVFGWCGFS